MGCNGIISKGRVKRLFAPRWLRIFTNLFTRPLAPISHGYFGPARISSEFMTIVSIGGTKIVSNMGVPKFGNKLAEEKNRTCTSSGVKRVLFFISMQFRQDYTVNRVYDL